MKWTVRAAGIGLLALASCAAPAGSAQVPTPSTPGQATIVAVRPVPAGWVEYVVRTGGGTTIAVVQPETAGLRPGAAVTLVGGASTTLAPR